ncbi:MAG TPA: anion permease [Marinilabiliales bacterium]|jgi:PiT family inorganic phosphate transporter|nr:inorganic phosphate transporter [Salinivirgaceae bacterium]OFX44116.1 MAG: inorganic phosphate transporter [Bacteroidetes bacterium GWA2_40_14]OFX59793.1 MAG: inorganic phosphate transporter [Bacteroidetes bacterium GWC2_40_13]OFX75646.1 MAG: inorganic phosphate transporter [Bacteroidetes bacterium GWD2_40_43]OFX95443.1 MAG: inorganic phosphate transporter [Bacteroidetes bacterium GWE2_40_63]OFY20446.1 MAG: inorganic phosphate transporter [Bacteroidetes bacterium GWF2_40_13]OFZ31919.1 MAG:
MFTLLIVILVLAFAFDLINGFHDAANSIATVVSTKVLAPFPAVLMAASFNFLAFWLFDLKVANTVAKTVESGSINLQVILAGLVAAIIWNLITWWRGIPSSSSHTLIGGFAGAAVAHTGSFAVINQEVILKTVGFIFLAPIIGMFIAYIISILILWVFRRSNPHKTTKWFKRAQLASSAAFSLGHGGSDSQKVVGIISAAMLVYIAYLTNLGMEIPHWAHVTETIDAVGKKHLHVPNWIPISCYIAIALGTMLGGWRIVKTMGTKITKVTPLEGVAAETAGAITLFGVSQGLGIPVSTTHTISGSIMGVGMTKRLSAVRWGVATNLLVAWILTIPVSMLVAALVYWAMMFIGF